MAKDGGLVNKVPQPQRLAAGGRLTAGDAVFKTKDPSADRDAREHACISQIGTESQSAGEPRPRGGSMSNMSNMGRTASSAGRRTGGGHGTDGRAGGDAGGGAEAGRDAVFSRGATGRRRRRAAQAAGGGGGNDG